MLYTKLCPLPRMLHPLEGTFQLPESPLCHIALEPQEAVHILQFLEDVLPACSKRKTGIGKAEESTAILFKIQDVPGKFSYEGYTLAITSSGITAEAPTPVGLFRAAATLLQILRLAGKEAIPCARIEDAPSIPTRGVMLDISRDRVPKLTTLFGLVDRLAELKINHLQLYMEHTFAYSAHPRAWENDSPLTPKDIHALDAYCKARFIELAPNQNSLGHFERWLKHPEYLPLAELPEGGAPLPWGGCQKAPAGLSPADDTVDAFIEALYDELLPCFSNRIFNIGCDETFDLGLGKSKVNAEIHGKGKTYLNYILRRYCSLKKRGCTLAFWGDIILHYPELIPSLPKDSIVIDWGYEADYPFRETARKFAKSGIPFWIAPGTSAWNSIGGRLQNMRSNIDAAATAAVENGASGFLITDWGDAGHWQAYPIRLPGILYGAACSWNPETNREIDIAEALDRHIFQATKGSPGRILCDLGRLYLTANATASNASLLFRLLNQPYTTPVPPGTITHQSLCEAETVCMRAEKHLATIRIDVDDAALLLAEIRITIHFLLFSLHYAAARLHGFTPEISRLLNSERQTLRQEYISCWRKRNRLSGLADSLTRIDAIEIP